MRTIVVVVTEVLFIREMVVGLPEDLTTHHENFDPEWLIQADVQEGKL